MPKELINMRFSNENAAEEYGTHELYDNIGLRDEVNKRLLGSRTILFACDTTQYDSATIVGLFLLLDSENQKPITLILNSLGGDISGLFAIYDVIQMVRSPVRTICIGDASSSAAVILASGSRGMRQATPNSHIMIHQIQIEGGAGSATDIEIEARATKKMKRKFNEILARHTGQSLRKVQQDCERDKYMTAEEALKYGIIDEIISPAKVIPELPQSRKRT